MSRCRDGFCGADDCDLCRGPFEPDLDEEANQADMDNDARAEREMLAEMDAEVPHERAA